MRKTTGLKRTNRYAILLLWSCKMLKIIDDEWLVDTEAMLCSNSLTKIVLGLTKNGETNVGKIKDMPMELTIKLAKMKNGNKLLQKAVMDAEEVFRNSVGSSNNTMK
jgi:hypothetical protein